MLNYIEVSSLNVQTPLGSHASPPDEISTPSSNAHFYAGKSGSVRKSSREHVSLKYNISTKHRPIIPHLFPFSFLSKFLQPIRQRNPFLIDFQP